MPRGIAPFARSITAFVDNLGPAATQLVQREAARVVRETRAASPIPPAYRINIGGKSEQILDGELPVLPLRPSDNVNLFFDHRREVAEQVWLILLRNSPHVSGDYKQAFTLFVDNREVGTPNLSSLKLIVPGTRVEIINLAPYARRLEVGKKADGSPFVVQVAPHIVERSVAEAAKGIYRRLSDIFFTYTDYSQAYQLSGSMIGSTYINNLGKRTKRRAWADRRAGSAITYPMVVLKERNYGVR